MSFEVEVGHASRRGGREHNEDFAGALREPGRGLVAAIGEVLPVSLPRPRNRVALAEDRDYVHYRKAVIDFLYTRQGHVEKAA